ncbi:hypothetical protein SAMN02745218_02986 [Desulfofundulus australicus DSM 11792]|uniref:PD(D/E)XK endonuclease domain-containing protein n=1 Tax=Desulfofundulus australicus DSM 11792 TaxID=1121425 RepID=A0A1M5E4C4_9FIRM|nr:hypothetical protein [Desulfofundulus australicus]SHF74073.1 hypothetical protein SAMN02745218_02986 [Desulfofundulus australicus DSM 11792]
MHDFNGCLKRGEDGEHFLDRFFSGRFHIYPVTRRQQRQGIDRIFVNRETGKVLKVEYKTDYQAGRTGNAFLETVSVDTEGKKGWVYTSKADYLLYFVVEDLLIYAIRFKTLRRLFPTWLKKYRTGKAVNEGYTTHGLLVPLTEFEKCAEAVISA